LHTSDANNNHPINHHINKMRLKVSPRKPIKSLTDCKKMPAINISNRQAGFFGLHLDQAGRSSDLPAFCISKLQRKSAPHWSFRGIQGKCGLKMLLRRWVAGRPSADQHDQDQDQDDSTNHY
jgi:hypothetical protein